ncbi:carboxypeptidase-like regulatory domain-containing protein [Lacipirellula sp.]|uniref:carboxypeptidase-like regulatory domain-containing protein n=1 Tax=Lacipirellula sp. TaxID=2691419 RepID=UPI003D14A2D4
MKSTHILLALVALSVIATPASAQQEVRLKSGGVLLGSATIDGEHAIVLVGDSTLKVPLANVAEISAVAKADQPQPRRMLLTALESRILNGASKEVVGILAEASRLSPEDPQIAFWYATSLLDAGYGKAAHEALQSNLAAIRKAYPGAADQLASRVEQRLAIEKLPGDLVQRLDHLAAHGRQRESGGSRDQRACYAVFRVVDQRGAPVQVTRQAIQASGNDEQLEPFSGGYYLFSFFQYSNNHHEPCLLNIRDIGVRQETLQLRIGESAYRLPQEIAVHRFDESDKRQLLVKAVGRDGKPLKGARVVLTPLSSNGNVSDQELDFKANAKGEASVQAFPGSYQVRVERPGFVSVAENVQIRNEDDSQQQEFKLYPQIAAAADVEWRWLSMVGGETLQGEVRAAFSTISGMQQQFPFPIRFEQEADSLFIHMMGPQMGSWNGRPHSRIPSIKEMVVETDNDQPADREAQQKAFDALDLKKLSDSSAKFKEIEFNQGRTSTRAPIEIGKIYVVTVTTINHQRGQPGELAFKVWVDRDTSVRSEGAARGEDSPFSGF